MQGDRGVEVRPRLRVLGEVQGGEVHPRGRAAVQRQLDVDGSIAKISARLPLPILPYCTVTYFTLPYLTLPANIHPYLSHDRPNGNEPSWDDIAVVQIWQGEGFGRMDLFWPAIYFALLHRPTNQPTNQCRGGQGKTKARGGSSNMRMGSFNTGT